MKESEYQQYLVKRCYDILPGRKLVDTLVFITDPVYMQGIQDLLVVHHGNHAFLEVKLAEDSPQQPNQSWYVNNWGRWCYSSFIYPKIEERVLREMAKALGA